MRQRNLTPAQANHDLNPKLCSLNKVKSFHVISFFLLGEGDDRVLHFSNST